MSLRIDRKVNSLQQHSPPATSLVAPRPVPPGQNVTDVIKCGVPIPTDRDTSIWRSRTRSTMAGHRSVLRSSAAPVDVSLLEGTDDNEDILDSSGLGTGLALVDIEVSTRAVTSGT